MKCPECHKGSLRITDITKGKRIVGRNVFCSLMGCNYEKDIPKVAINKGDSQCQ